MGSMGGFIAASMMLLLLGGQSAAAADADAWRSQIIYFLVTDRFSPSPGATPAAACKRTDWNSGTWAGITDKLDYMQDLGATAVWITPIPYQYQGNFFGFTGYAGYWTQDWTRLEPHYGSEQDLLHLLNAIRAKGMLSMLDVVANHAGPVGSDFSAIVPFNSSDHYHACGRPCDADCNIPQAAYDTNDATAIETCRLQGLADLNQSVPFVAQQLRGWLNHTLTKYPFDAIRIDTVKHVAAPFWADFTAALPVRPAAPGNASSTRTGAAAGEGREARTSGRLFSIGEVMHGDTHVLAKYVTGPTAGMDSVLNFPLYYKLADVFQRQQDMRGLLAEREKQAAVLGPELVSRLGVFIDNHDGDRFLARQPDKQLLANALAFALLTEGIPVVYYGTEQGLAGAAAGDANRECLWEAGYGRDGQLFTLIRTLAGLRTSRALWNATQTDLNVTSDCFVFSRGPDVLVVTTNRGSGGGSDTGKRPPVFRLQSGSSGNSSSSSSESSSSSCVVRLPEDVTLLDGGVAAVTDVLQPGQPSAAGLTWDPANRALTVQTPQGAPRVLSSTRFIVGNLSSTVGNSSSADDSVPTQPSQQEWNPPAAVTGNTASSGSNTASSGSIQRQLVTGLLLPMLAMMAAVL